MAVHESDGAGGLADEHHEDFRYPGAGLGGRFASASEYVAMVFHDSAVTHLDALSHAFWDRQMYNGRPAELVTSRSGATSLDVTVARDGFFTRGYWLT